MNTISNYLHRHKELNTAIKTMVKCGAVGYDQQRLVTEFYNDYNDTKILDKILLDLVINSDKERCANIIF